MARVNYSEKQVSARNKAKRFWNRQRVGYKALIAARIEHKERMQDFRKNGKL